MIKCSFTKKEVTVYNLKVTLVVLKGTLKVPKKFRIDILTSNIVPRRGNCFGDTIRVEGRSACADNDTFDPIIGERIAEARAKIKLYRILKNICNNLLKYYNKELGFEVPTCADNTVFGDYLKYTKLLRKEEEHLEKLIDES